MAKKITVIAGSLVLVAAVVACVVVLVVNKESSDVKDGSSGVKSSSVKAVQALCEPSSDRQICESEMTKAAGDKTDLKSLIRIALEIPRNYVVDSFNKSALLAAAAKDPENTVALEDCRRLFGYAIQNYDKALENYDGWDITELYKLADDMDVVLTSANTFQNDCKDSLQDKKNAAAQEITRILNISIPMSESAVKISKKVVEFANNNISTMLQDLFGGSKRELAEAAGGRVWSESERNKVMDEAPWTRKPLVTVAKDGSGQFKTIMEGLAAMPTKNKDYVVMHIKEGVYKEKVEVGRGLNKLVIVGDGPTKTRVSGNLNVMMVGMNISTFRTPSFAVVADEFIAKDIGFENTAGPEGHQAVAFRSQSDKSVLYNCHFDAYQDTLYAHTQRQFYRDCTISGTVDFIFGDSISIFQNCKMVVRKPLPNQQNIVTAHGSKFSNSSTVFVLQNCTITADPLLVPFIAKNPSYLGRPWKPFARTIIMQSYIDTVIHPDGWMPWPSEPDSINTCLYAEIDNRGPGADKSKRVKWPGVKTLNLKDANLYTVGFKFHEQTWPQDTGVPVFAGMLPATQGAKSH